MTWVNLNDLYVPTSGGAISNDLSVSGELNINGNIVGNGSTIEIADGSFVIRNENGYAYLEVPRATDGKVSLGWGAYKNEASTYIYGNDVLFQTANATGSWRPYYQKGDTITFSNYKTAGYVTSSKTQVHFNVPLGKPVIGSPTVTLASTDGFILRQDGNYTHGTSSDTYMKPSSYNFAIRGDNLCGYATFSTTTNAVNNQTVGIVWYGTVTFS